MKYSFRHMSSIFAEGISLDVQHFAIIQYVYTERYAR